MPCSEQMSFWTLPDFVCVSRKGLAMSGCRVLCSHSVIVCSPSLPLSSFSMFLNSFFHTTFTAPWGLYPQDLARPGPGTHFFIPPLIHSTHICSKAISKKHRDGAMVPVEKPAHRGWWGLLWKPRLGLKHHHPEGSTLLLGRFHQECNQLARWP